MIDVEQIADKIRPKDTVIKLISDSDPTKKDAATIFQDYPFKREIYLARDIKNLSERKQHLMTIIEKQKNYNVNIEYAEPWIKTGKIILNGKELKFNMPIPEKIRRTPDLQLIKQCENELNHIEDLIRVEIMAKEYKAILGQNERQYYLFYAKEGQTHNNYAAPKHYSIDEFAQIVTTASKLIDENTSNVMERDNEASQTESNPKLMWTGATIELTTLFYDMKETGLIQCGNTEIGKMIVTNFLDKNGKVLKIDKVIKMLTPSEPKSKNKVDFSKLL